MVLGIAGTSGAGKGTVVEYLQEKGFRHISARDIWTQELTARGIEVNRDTMTKLANDLRAEHGAAYFMEQALANVDSDDNVVIESVRTVAEVELLKESQGTLLAVDANQQLRFERNSKRGSSLDNITFADFVRQEEAELQNDDPNKQNILKVVQLADYTITNDGTLEELHQKIDAWLATIQS